MLYAIVALLAIILDQWLKLWVSGNIVLNSGSVPLIPGVVSLTNIHNTGAAFGFLGNLASSKTVFIVVCIVFVVLAIALLAGNVIKGKLGRWCIVMVMAGGIANCIDRILYGYVQDMIKVDFINFAIFNVADIFITVFCVLFIFYIIFGSRKDDDDDYDDDDEDYEDEEDDEDDDFDDDDDEEEEPARPLFKKSRAKPREEAPAPAPAPKAASASRKARQQEVDDKYARFKAERAAREQSAAPVKAAAPKAVPVASEDPFAEWERKARESRAAEEKAAVKKAVQSEPKEEDPFAAWERANRRAEPAAPKARAVSLEEAAAAAPAPKAAPAPAPAPKPKVSESFDLDDILNEFK